MFSSCPSSAFVAGVKIGAGLGRSDAYRLVQGHAMQAWDEERDFRELVAADPEISSRLDADALESVFDLDATVQHVDVAFERLRSLANRTEAVHV